MGHPNIFAFLISAAVLPCFSSDQLPGEKLPVFPSSRNGRSGLSITKGNVVYLPNNDARLLPKVYLTAGVATSGKFKGWGGGGGGGWGIPMGWGSGGGGGGGGGGWNMGNIGWGPPGGGGGGGWGFSPGWMMNNGWGWKKECEDKKAKKKKAKAKKKKAKAKKKAMKKGWGGGGGDGWGGGGGVGGQQGWGGGGSGWGGGGQGQGGGWRPQKGWRREEEGSEEVWPNSPPRSSRREEENEFKINQYNLLETTPLFMVDEELREEVAKARNGGQGSYITRIPAELIQEVVGTGGSGYLPLVVKYKLDCPELSGGNSPLSLCSYILVQ